VQNPDERKESVRMVTIDTATLASFNEFEEACIQKKQLIPVLSQSSITFRLHRCTWCMKRKWQKKQ
jgi:hypothetical protein